MADPTLAGRALALRLQDARDQMQRALAIIDECDELAPAAILDHAIGMLDRRLSCLDSRSR